MKELAAASITGTIFPVDSWELNQTKIERVKDLPRRLTGIAGWYFGKWNECWQRMLRGEPALPLKECVNPLFVELIKLDREYTRERFELAIFREFGLPFSSENGNPEPVGARDRVRILGENGQFPIDEIKAGEVDVIWINGEIEYTILMTDVALWLKKFAKKSTAYNGKQIEELSNDDTSCDKSKENTCARLDSFVGLIGGGFHDIYAWFASTACVEMLIGTPEVIAEDGQWFKRINIKKARFANSYPLTIPLLNVKNISEINKQVGIVLYQFDKAKQTIEDIFVLLHALRKFWVGEIVIMFSGEESGSVRIAAARYDAVYLELPEPEVIGNPRTEQKIFITPEEHVRQWTPFQNTLWIEGKSIAIERKISEWIDAIDISSELSNNKKQATWQGSVCELNAVPCSIFPKRVDILRCDVNFDKTESLLWQSLEEEVIKVWAATVRVRHGATIVIGILPEDLLIFKRNWIAAKWRHAAMTLSEEQCIHQPVPILLGLCGITEADVYAAKYQNAKISSFFTPPDSNEGSVARPGPEDGCFSVNFIKIDADKFAAEQPDMFWGEALAEAAKTAQTEWLIYLDPIMDPSPGAELFLSHRLEKDNEENCQIYAPGWAFRKIGDLEWHWIQRILNVQESPMQVIPEDLRKNQILKHLKLGSPATMIRTNFMRDAYAEWENYFSDVPFEIFLTLRLRRDIPSSPKAHRLSSENTQPLFSNSVFSPAGMCVCRPQDWGWNT